MAKRPKSTIPRYRRRRQRSFGRRMLSWIVRLVLIFLIGSVLWVLAYPVATLLAALRTFARRDL